MQSTFRLIAARKIIRRWLLFFMLALFVSGITAIPAEWELSMVLPFFSYDSVVGKWLNTVFRGVQQTGTNYPFLFYGYDWLAFAHVVLAILFIGPYRDPVRNKWIIEFAAYACLLIVPFALIAGFYRGIPFWWRFVDCAFGIVGLIPLLICYRKIQLMEKLLANEKRLETY